MPRSCARCARDSPARPASNRSRTWPDAGCRAGLDLPLRRQPSDEPVLAADNLVASNYFSTVGVPFVAGTDFPDESGGTVRTDRPGRRPVRDPQPSPGRAAVAGRIADRQAAAGRTARSTDPRRGDRGGAGRVLRRTRRGRTSPLHLLFECRAAVAAGRDDVLHPPPGRARRDRAGGGAGAARGGQPGADREPAIARSVDRPQKLRRCGCWRCC